MRRPFLDEKFECEHLAGKWKNSPGKSILLAAKSPNSADKPVSSAGKREAWLISPFLWPITGPNLGSWTLLVASYII